MMFIACIHFVSGFMQEDGCKREISKDEAPSNRDKKESNRTQLFGLLISNPMSYLQNSAMFGEGLTCPENRD